MKPRNQGNKKHDAQIRRERLFSRSKPEIRPATKDDIVWIRVNQRLAGVEMSDEDFNALIDRALSQYSKVFIIADRNEKFGAKFGPVGMVAAIENGVLFEPHVDWFSWATPRNILRGAVAFFQKFRYRHCGTLVVHALKDSAPFFRRLKSYVPLYYVGKIPDGDPAGRGDDYIFFQRCREP